MKQLKYWIIANVIGIGIYFCFAIPTWPTLIEQDVACEFRADTFASDLWLFICCPLFLLYLVINFICFVLYFGIMKGRQRWLSLLIWILVEAIWFFSFVYDRDRASRETPRIEEMRQRGAL